MNAVATEAKTKTPKARSLSLEHFAFYRAYLEGPVAIDLPFLADRYLNCGTDPRKVRALLRWLQEELAAAARRADDREAVRLLRLPKILGTTEAVVDLPSLEEFREVVDPEGEFSETDLLALYQERYPSAPKTRQEQRGVRLHTRRLDALRRLQSLVVEAPDPTHALSGWLEPSVAVRLNTAGLVTLQQLIDGINMFGERWYTRIKGLGRERAGRIVRWIESHAPSLGTLSARASAPLRSVSRDVLFAERILTSTLGPVSKCRRRNARQRKSRHITR